MTPAAYARYAQAHDYFSDRRLFPPFYAFFDRVLDYATPGAAVADIGGGSGLFSAYLLNWMPTLRLTFIEPSALLMASARERLPATTHFIPRDVSSALQELRQPQQILILSRSLYALCRTRTAYPDLFREFYAVLASGGLLAIQDLHSPPPESRDKHDRYATLLGVDDSTRATFESNWVCYAQMREEFRRGVEAGDYFLFQAEELDCLLGAAGFTRLSYQARDSSYQCFYQRD